jgi:two-component system KDP operon response regulator KdpE
MSEVNFVDGQSAANNMCYILLVEDDQASASAIAKLLKADGYSITTAYSIANARSVSAAIRFDVLICDAGLPDGDGRTLLREMQERYPIAGIVISGRDSHEDIAASIAAGFKAHIVKPFPITKLIALIKAVVASPWHIRSEGGYAGTPVN